MFLHLGGDAVVPTREIIAILDIKLAVQRKDTRKDTGDFLKVAEEEGFLVDISDSSPKSFVITTKHVYLSPISPATLKKRAESGIIFDTTS